MLAYDADTFMAGTGQIAGAWWGGRIPARWLGRDPGEGKSSGWIISYRVLNPTAAMTLAPHAAQPRPDVNADHWLRRRFRQSRRVLLRHAG